MILIVNVLFVNVIGYIIFCYYIVFEKINAFWKALKRLVFNLVESEII
jgi:hypothetical protein